MKRWAAVALVALAIGAAIGGALYYADAAPNVDLVALQFAGGAESASSVVGGNIDPFIAAIDADLWLIVGYAISLVAACVVGAQLFYSQRGRRLASVGLSAAMIAAISDFVENEALGNGLRALGTASQSDGPFEIAAAAASVKWALLVPAGLVALASIALTTKRLLAGLLRTSSLRKRAEAIDELASNIVPPAPIVDERGQRWPPKPAVSDERWVANGTERWGNASRVPPGRPPANVGFCVSGGGIRAACVTLGALQSLRKELQSARYLVSVSGGGYMAGAVQLAMCEPPADGSAKLDATANNVFRHGSLEEDYLRRHSSYIADGVWQWIVALGIILRGVLASLALIAATVVSIGLGLEVFYSQAPLADFSGLTDYFTRNVNIQPPFPKIVEPAVTLILFAAVGVIVLWILRATLGSRRRVRPILRQIITYVARHVMQLDAIVAFFVAVIPAVVWGSAWLAWKLPQVPSAAAGIIGTVFATYTGALVAILWKRRKKIGEAAKKVGGLFGRKEGGVTQSVPSSLGQHVIVWAVLAFLLVVALATLGATISIGDSWPLWQRIAVPGALALVALRVDQTWLSLHPFYRRRLATAFSIRRLRLKDQETAAVPYDFDREETSLTTHAGRHADLPQIIFSAAANLSGQERTPPGRRAVSFSLSHDYIGGPDVGYVQTASMERAVSNHLRMDLTVQAAVAISGAAFASAMGRQARAIQTLLALSNARLGTWVPNPAYAQQLSDPSANWALPWFPSVRRLSYLLREILGSFPHDERLLYVTDGGHYDNLGLVELLRHKCRNVFCIDASGDTPPFAQTLAEAMTLAEEELGVRIRFENPLTLVPGSAKPPEPSEPLTTLAGRLSKEAVIVGRITYPWKIDFGDGTLSDKGRIIVAKAVLTPDLPYELMAYAQANPVFPRDSTSDQWFDHGQFDAYHALGRFIGARAATSARDLHPNQVTVIQRLLQVLNS